MTTGMLLSEIAEKLECSFAGDGNQLIQRIVHPLQARQATDMALILDKSIVPLLPQLQLKTVLLPEGFELPGIPNQLFVKRPKVALAHLLEWFNLPPFVYPEVHERAYVDPTAELGEHVSIGPNCWVGPGSKIGAHTRLIANVSVGANVTIGEHCLFYPGVYLGDRIVVGNQVICQANATIGSDGFSYVTESVGSVETARSSGKVEAENTSILRINSIGTVVLEDGVEIGANTCVDRATLGETRIKRNAKIDNQVQIAHNVVIGENCLFAAQVGISGSTTVGDRTVIAGQAGLPDHVTVGSDCIITAKCGVTKSVEDKTIMVGAPGLPRKEFLHKEMQLKQARAMVKDFKLLSQRVEELEASVLESKEPVTV